MARCSRSAILITSRRRFLSLPLIFVALFTFVFSCSAYAEKQAFVLGIADYENVNKLSSPKFDADRIKEQLVELGYNVTRVDDDMVDKLHLAEAWGEFVDNLDPNDDVVVYYSGHGVEVDGTNYMVPVDVPSPRDIHSTIALREALMSLSQMMKEVTDKGVNESIWILDACRDDPFARLTKGLDTPGGLNANLDQGGVFIFYAAGINETALDRLPTDASGAKVNSVFTRVLLDFLAKEPSDESELFAVHVRTAVRELAKQANQEQHPAYYDQLAVPYCFQPCTEVVGSDVAVHTSAGAHISVPAVVTELALAHLPQSPLAPASGLLPRSLSGDIATRVAASVNPQLAPTVVTDITNALSSNVVFLGRESSATSCREGEVSDKFPFGCNLLKSAKNQEISKLVGSQVQPLTKVNIRKTAPIFNGGSFHLSCVVGQADVKDTTTITSIISRSSAGPTADSPADKLYFATIDGPQRDCLTAQARQ